MEFEIGVLTENTKDVRRLLNMRNRLWGKLQFKTECLKKGIEKRERILVDSAVLEIKKAVYSLGSKRPYDPALFELVAMLNVGTAQMRRQVKKAEKKYSKAEWKVKLLRFGKKNPIWTSEKLDAVINGK